MNPRIETLMKKYPMLFKEQGPRCGFYIGEGWMSLIERLCETIDHHVKHRVPEELRADIYVAQVKEKFGQLRFYMNASTQFIDGAIFLAESLSFQICEDCGQPGKQRNGAWIRTQCDLHFEAQEKAALKAARDMTSSVNKQLKKDKALEEDIQKYIKKTPSR